MGDPKSTKKKFSAPPHPWQKSRIEEERELVREFGLKNKKEAWKMKTLAKKFADQAKKLTALDTEQSKSEKEHLLSKLYSLSLLQKGATTDDVLGLTPRDILERRLQTIVFKKGYSKSVKQARQFITHRHVAVGDKVITSPSYIVSSAEEAQITFMKRSAFADEEHPERASGKDQMPARKPKKEDKKAEGKKAEKPAKTEKSKAKEDKADKKKEEPAKEEVKKEAKPEAKEEKKEEAKAEEKK